MTDQQMLLGAVSALAGALLFLWRQIDSAAKKCEKDRDNLWQALIKIHGNGCRVSGGTDKSTLDELVPPKFKENR